VLSNASCHLDRQKISTCGAVMDWVSFLLVEAAALRLAFFRVRLRTSTASIAPTMPPLDIEAVTSFYQCALEDQ